MPIDVAASIWPSSTEMSPARAISDMYAASFRPRPTIAAVHRAKSVMRVDVRRT